MYEALWFLAGFFSCPILAAIFMLCFWRWLELGEPDTQPIIPPRKR